MLLTLKSVLRGRNWSDWVGFVFFIGFAGFLMIRAPRLSLLLLPSIIHEVLTSISFLMRSAPRARLTAPAPRSAAYAGTFIIPVFMLIVTGYAPQWLKPSPWSPLLSIGLLLWLLGTPLVLLGIWRLRRSFSIEPQARQLVTTGPYALARHPIYTGYLLQYLGILLAHLTAVFAAVLVIWLVLAVIRIGYEEAVLTATFPEYATYKRTVGMLGPTLKIESLFTADRRVAKKSAGGH